MSYVLSFRRKANNSQDPMFYHKYETRWTKAIPIVDKAINYLEIGVLHGINAIAIANTYCKHPDSKIYCVDPWKDYDEYPEYKGQQYTIYETFNKNINKHENPSKFIVKRGLSGDIVPTFDNDFFDMIYVDGNHEPEYVYTDGKMAFDKVKREGYIIFDDYSFYWPQTVKGIDMFLEEYKSKIKIISNGSPMQMIVQKL
jgi:predicted O-methyltransferase YrrM